MTNDFEQNILNSFFVTEGITAYPVASEISVKWLRIVLFSCYFTETTATTVNVNYIISLSFLTVLV